MNPVYTRFDLIGTFTKLDHLLSCQRKFSFFLLMIMRQNSQMSVSILLKVFGNIKIFKKQEPAAQFPVKKIREMN